MLGQITWRQFLEWEAFSELEPFDEERADIRSAQIVAALANIHRDRKKRRTPFKLSDFLLQFGDSTKVGRAPGKTWQQMKALGKSLAASFSSTDTRGQRKKR